MLLHWTWANVTFALVIAAFSHALPHLHGDRLNAKIIDVTYAPGASSRPHTHPCPVIVYVVEGAVRSGVRGGTVAIYHAGESFYEAPNTVHAVSANASAVRPARFLAYFVCDTNAPLSEAR